MKEVYTATKAKQWNPEVLRTSGFGRSIRSESAEDQLWSYPICQEALSDCLQCGEGYLVKR